MKTAVHDPTPPCDARPDRQARSLEAACRPWLGQHQRLRVGIDTVEVAGIDASLAAFGERFERRLFTAHERAAADRVPAHRAERLAARFAAKEAVIKALSLGEAGVGWRDIELHSAADGAPTLRLHGSAAARATAAGVCELVVSLSHDGAQACAVVVALCAEASAGGAAAGTVAALPHEHPSPPPPVAAVVSLLPSSPP